MSRLKGPAAGTLPRQLLRALGAAPNGVLSYAQALLVMTQENRSVGRFETQAMRPLERNLLAMCEGDVIRLLPAGDAFLQQCRADFYPTVARNAGQIAQPRTVRPFKPMGVSAFSKLMAGGPQRPGMAALLDAPSLMGDARVARASHLLIEGDA